MTRRAPYIPLGVTQQSRVVPTKLREADLDRAQAERAAAAQSLPDLLLAKGSMSGPYRAAHPMRRHCVSAGLSTPCCPKEKWYNHRAQRAKR